jgi:hypothetical protein
MTPDIPEGQAKVSGSFLMMGQCAQQCFDLAVIENGLDVVGETKAHEKCKLLIADIADAMRTFTDRINDVKDECPDADEMSRRAQQARLFGREMVVPQIDGYDIYPLKVNTREAGPCNDPNCPNCTGEC